VHRRGEVGVDARMRNSPAAPPGRATEQPAARKLSSNCRRSPVCLCVIRSAIGDETATPVGAHWGSNRVMRA